MRLHPDDATVQEMAATAIGVLVKGAPGAPARAATMAAAGES